MDLSEADKTLNPGVFTVLLRLKAHTAPTDLQFKLTLTHDHLLTEDLDKTLEAPGQRMSPKGDIDPECSHQQVQYEFVFNILILYEGLHAQLV